jgi:predicted nucleic acid-binding protein
VSASPRRYIIDASVAIKWLFDDEDFTSEARSVLLAFQEGRIDLLAPDHLYHEVLNALRTGVRMRRVRADDAEEAVHDFLDLAIPTVAGRSLFVAGFTYALSYDCAFYDGLYLTLADQAGCPLLHADRRLHNALQGRFSREFWIEDANP